MVPRGPRSNQQKRKKSGSADMNGGSHLCPTGRSGAHPPTHANAAPHTDSRSRGTTFHPESSLVRARNPRRPLPSPKASPIPPDRITEQTADTLAQFKSLTLGRVLLATAELVAAAGGRRCGQRRTRRTQRRRVIAVVGAGGDATARSSSRSICGSGRNRRRFSTPLRCTHGVATTFSTPMRAGGGSNGTARW